MNETAGTDGTAGTASHHPISQPPPTPPHKQACLQTQRWRAGSLPAEVQGTQVRRSYVNSPALLALPTRSAFFTLARFARREMDMRNEAGVRGVKRD